MSPDTCPESRALFSAEKWLAGAALVVIAFAYAWEPFIEPLLQFIAWAMLLACGENPEWPAR